MKTESAAPITFPPIDLTPLRTVVSNARTPALLRSPGAAEPHNVKIEFMECALVEEGDGETVFQLTFTISSGEGEEQTSQQVKKLVTISNEALAEEARVGEEGLQEMANRLEARRLADLAEARRMRELAGIPHKDNFV